MAASTHVVFGVYLSQTSAVSSPDLEKLRLSLKGQLLRYYKRNKTQQTRRKKQPSPRNNTAGDLGAVPICVIYVNGLCAPAALLQRSRNALSNHGITVGQLIKSALLVTY